MYKAKKFNRVHKKILKFSDFTSEIRPKAVKIQEDAEPNILQQVLNQSGTKSGDLKSISIADLFYATSVGKKFASELGKDENKDLAQILKKRGLIPSDIVPDPEQVDSQLKNADAKKAAEENIKALNDAGIVTASGTDSQALFDQLISSGDYNLTDIKRLDWDGMKYILDKFGFSKKLDFDKYNLIGLRNYLSVKKKHPNRFVDALILMGPESSKEIMIMPGTTVPGPFFMVNKFRNWWLASTGKSVLSPGGLAILQPGVYSYKIGKHNNYEALVQNGKVNVERFELVDDPKKANFSTFSPGKSQSGNFGINIHRGNKSGETSNVQNHSAGCIVLKKSSDLEEILQKLKKAGQNTVDFALVEMDEIPSEVLATATKQDKDSKSGSA
jgi:hypothetical protein